MTKLVIMRRALLALLLTTACSQTELRPAAEATRSGQTVVEQQGGLKVMANAQSWRGSADVKRELVPVELVIENGTEQTFHFSPRDVQIVGAGKTLVPVSDDRLRNLEPQPTSVGLDPRVPQEMGGEPLMEYEPPEVTELRQEAIGAAIQEGPIPPGYQRRGFVYFEALPSSPKRVELQVAVRGDQGAEPVTMILPFEVVKRKR